MKLDVEINESEIQQAVHHGIKNAISARIKETSYQKSGFRTKLEGVIDEMLPRFVEEAFKDIDIKKIIDAKVEQKVDAIVKRTINNLMK